MTVLDKVAACDFLRDGSDGCRVYFTSREHAVGAHGLMLLGVVMKVFEVYTPKQPNSHSDALYHMNHRYTLGEIIDKED